MTFLIGNDLFGRSYRYAFSSMLIAQLLIVKIFCTLIIYLIFSTETHFVWSFIKTDQNRLKIESNKNKLVADSSV